MISAIFVAGKSGQPQQQILDVEVRLGLGITGDRHFKKHRRPGQNISFIEIESIENFNASFNQNIDLQATRRNIITRGVDLNVLVNKEFSIGKARFRGVELCEPCIILGRLLKSETLSEKDVITAFWGRGGLRAEVLRDGILSVGMTIETKG
ncbi:hypothetical protein MNBD_GAMMA07-173 [hydrothermal vent metagenome]|uniref:MOSC domain-containing protein n=1 Tax=hydrothermal vent metagenome TaxID=652676 RepID=A0A3B0WGP8_9ZZZZ